MGLRTLLDLNPVTIKLLPRLSAFCAGAAVWAVTALALAQASPASPGASSPEPTAPAPPDPAVEPLASLGSTPVQAPSDAPAKPVLKKNQTPRPFAGSSIYNQNSVTTGTVFRGQQRYANSTVESTVFFLPRYAISEAFQLRARAILTYEYTNSDSSTYRNEPLLSDTTVQLFYRSVPKILGFQPAVAVGLGAPTSKLSRARTMVVNPSATLQLARPIERFFGGEALILASAGYSHPFYRSENPTIDDTRSAGAFACVGGNNCQDLISGSQNPSDILSYSALFEAEWGKWSPAIFYLGASQWAYRPATVSNPVDGTPLDRPSGFEPTSVRQTHYFSVWLDYNFNSWFTGEVGFWNAVSGIDGAGKRSNVFFDRYQDTRAYLGASIQLDNLVKAVQGNDDGEAGVVRAKNNRTPSGLF